MIPHADEKIPRIQIRVLSLSVNALSDRCALLETIIALHPVSLRYNVQMTFVALAPEWAIILV